jgi:bacteriophage N4 adsorption protein B
MAVPVSAVLVVLQGLQSIEHELLLFAVFWFVLGTIDEFAVDLCWLALRLTGRAAAQTVPDDVARQALEGKAAVFIATWQESEVIGATITHMLHAWVQSGYVIYVGCYRNDNRTISAVMAAAGDDPRVRLVIHGQAGPTTKADCLNRLYRALEQDEARCCVPYRGVLIHDAEDMVHPAALALIDQALGTVDFVQLPVRPEPQRRSRWIAGHYSDEFCESHAKALVVRDSLRAAIPAAGVGCGFARAALFQLAAVRQADGEAGPFAAQCLTEDYELGLLMSRSARGSRFLRLRDTSGALVATRSYFPAELPDAVRQKTRWMHGIALQSWDRLGWSGSPVDIWMALRDRRGPLIALVLAIAYVLLLIEALLWAARQLGFGEPQNYTPIMAAALGVTLFGMAWRALFRFAFTTREYGLREGLLALARIPVANIIAIMAGRRALVAYVRSLLGEAVVWEKTGHSHHPAQFQMSAPPIIRAAGA